jgi:glycosyltransferase involved in cell wall biosynthesis
VVAMCRIAPTMLSRRLPYHAAVLTSSLRGEPEARALIEGYEGTVFTSNGHWGSLIADRPSPSPSWILNQCDADVQFWSAYAAYSRRPHVKLAAMVNERLARNHFPRVYAKVGRVISVCEEDRRLAQALAPNATVEVIENGVDCAYFAPNPEWSESGHTVLFAGTSATRNLVALSHFTKAIWPNVRRAVPDARLCVAGDFSEGSQAPYRDRRDVEFTGYVDDIRPYYWSSQVFVAPFADAHGSKLKVAQALAMGMPVVATPHGARGFEVVDGESLLIGKDDEEFAAKVSESLLDPNLRRRIGTAAREFALRRLDWNVLGNRLGNIVEDTWRGQKR